VFEAAKSAGMPPERYCDEVMFPSRFSVIVRPFLSDVKPRDRMMSPLLPRSSSIQAAGLILFTVTHSRCQTNSGLSSTMPTSITLITYEPPNLVTFLTVGATACAFNQLADSLLVCCSFPCEVSRSTVLVSSVWTALMKANLIYVGQHQVTLLFPI